MLVLSRRLGEAIVIGDSIHLTIVDVGGGKVKLGIDAPEEVRIDREEVFQRRNEFLAPADHALVCDWEQQ